MSVKFANPAIEGVFFGALALDQSTCDNCGNTVPLNQSHRVCWEFIVCDECRPLVPSRLMFRKEEISMDDPSRYCDGMDNTCSFLMAPSMYRILDGVETCIFQRRSTCSYCS